MKWERPLLNMMLGLIAIGFVAFHISSAFVGTPPLFVFRGAHLAFALVFIYVGFLGTGSGFSRFGAALGLIGTILSIGYILLEQDYILFRFSGVDPLTKTDLFLGIVLISVLYEAGRRTVGVALPLTALLFVGFAFQFKSLPLSEIIDYIYLTPEGIFGIPLNVSATYMVLFILFGAYIDASGTGLLFRDLALAFAGRSAGGPAKVAVIASGFFGSVSGSSTANVMTTGVFTIPMMRQVGYKPAFAAAVEAVASTGGQILPPIMGAAAFVMAEFMGRPYLDVIAFATIPALLYFLAVYMAVHFEAKRNGLKGLPRADLPVAGQVIRERGHQLIPVFAMVAMLLNGFSAPYSALVGCALIFPVSALRKSTRASAGPKNIVTATVQGARNCAPVAVVTALAGIVVGVVTLTSVGLDFTSFVLWLAKGYLLPALILTAIVGMILGMGLPTTPAYIVQVALLVPALIAMGVVEPAAHFFVLYFAILSSITPPVAITLFAAMSLSGTRLGETSLAAFKLAATGYLIPFLFVYGPGLLLIGPWPDVILAVLTAIAGVTLMAAGLHRYFFGKLGRVLGALLVVAAVCLAYSGWQTDLLGIGISVIVFMIQRKRKQSVSLA